MNNVIKLRTIKSARQEAQDAIVWARGLTVPELAEHTGLTEDGAALALDLVRVVVDRNPYFASASPIVAAWKRAEVSR